MTGQRKRFYRAIERTDQLAIAGGGPRPDIGKGLLLSPSQTLKHVRIRTDALTALQSPETSMKIVRGRRQAATVSLLLFACIAVSAADPGGRTKRGAGRGRGRPKNTPGNIHHFELPASDSACDENGDCMEKNDHHPVPSPPPPPPPLPVEQVWKQSETQKPAGEEQEVDWDPHRRAWRETGMMMNVTLQALRKEKWDKDPMNGAPGSGPNFQNVNRKHKRMPGTSIIRTEETGAEFHVKHPTKGNCVMHKKLGRMQCLPSLIFIGLGHSGSTSFFHALSEHPQMVANDVGHRHKPGRETWFFNKFWNPQWSTQFARAAYADLFPELEEGGMQVTYEKTPTYWRDIEVPARMASIVPNATLVLFLRNPVTWLHSRFYPNQRDAAGFVQEPDMNQKKDPAVIAHEEQEFEALLEREGWGMCNQLPKGMQEFLRHYPRDQVIVELTENYKADPVSLLRRVEKSIGLTPFTWNEEALKRRKYHVQQRDRVTNKHRKLIRDRCREPILELEQILGMEIQSVWDDDLATVLG